MLTLPSYNEAIPRPSSPQRYQCPCSAMYPHDLTIYSSYVTGHKFCAGLDGQTTPEDHTLHGNFEPGAQARWNRATDHPGDFRAGLSSIVAARHRHLRPPNLSQRAEQLADILLWILANEYGGIDTRSVLPWMHSMRAWMRAGTMATVLRDQREREPPKRNSPQQRYLKERLYKPCKELGLPVEAAERIMLQFQDAKFRKGDQCRLQQVKGEEGLDALALNLCCDAVQIIPVVARTEQGIETLLRKVEELSKRDFPDGHCWLEFLPQVVRYTK